MKKLQLLLLAWGAPALFLFAVIDGAGLPTPGGLDLALVTLAVNRPANAYVLAMLTLVGSLIGCMILFTLARRGGEAILTKYRSRRRFILFELWFQKYGLLTVFIPALLPIPLPLKFFILCAAVFEVRPLAFFATLLLARIPRYLGLAYLGRNLGTESWPWLMTHKWYLMAFATGLFASLYLLILITDRRSRQVSSS